MLDGRSNGLTHGGLNVLRAERVEGKHGDVKAPVFSGLNDGDFGEGRPVMRPRGLK